MRQIFTRVGVVMTCVCVLAYYVGGTWRVTKVAAETQLRETIATRPINAQPNTLAVADSGEKSTMPEPAIAGLLIIGIVMLTSRDRRHGDLK